MAFDDLINDCKARLGKALDALGHEFGSIRTGRASPAILDRVRVEAYGSPTSIHQCAGVSVPDSTQLMIKPWDKSLLRVIEKAIVDANLGLVPNNDGSVIRINMPPLSTERRQALAQQAKESCEKCKVSMRNQRRDAIKTIETKAKEQKASEDATKQATTKISDLLKQFEGKADTMLKDKTEEILKL